MVGRWPSGAPVTLTPDADDPTLAEANDFSYQHGDAEGNRESNVARVHNEFSAKDDSYVRRHTHASYRRWHISAPPERAHYALHEAGSQNRLLRSHASGAPMYGLAPQGPAHNGVARLMQPTHKKDGA